MNKISTVSFSLDCELAWGIPTGQHDYIKHAVKASIANLYTIARNWDSNYPTLYLAFVAISTQEYIDYYPESENLSKEILSERGYECFLNSKELLNFGKTLHFQATNIQLGLHGEFHNLHRSQKPSKIQEEIERISRFASDNPAYNSIYVYPKNQSPLDHKSNEILHRTFTLIRRNPENFLYNNQVYNKYVRFFRYLDSFLPILEILTIFSGSTSPPQGFIIGHYYFRAQLKPILLALHFFRILIFVKILQFLGRPAHIWSHPHNFTTQFSTRLFIKLAALTS